MFKANQHFLHVVLGFPLNEDVELCGLNLTIALVHTWEVHLGVEAHLGGLHGVVRATLNCQEEDTVVKLGVRRTNDCAIPVSESCVITFALSFI